MHAQMSGRVGDVLLAGGAIPPLALVILLSHAS